jgi:hypothetical protein
MPLPTLNVSLPQQNVKEETPVVTNNEMVDMYKKIFSYMEADRGDSDEAFRTFMDMAVNDGDASHSTKECMVQLLKIRTECTNNMTKVMDLLMRYILKDRDTFPRYLAANQENNIIFKGGSKRQFLEKLEKNKARKVEDKR